MAIEFTCSGCGKKMKTDDIHAGKKGKCPKCGAKVDIPLPGMPTRKSAPKPSAPSVPMSPAPSVEPQAPEADLFGAAPGSTVSFDANQDFLSELAGPAAGATTPLGESGGLTPLPDHEQAGYANPAGYASQPASLPQPSYSPPPGYAPPPHPYGAYAPGYRPAPSHGQAADAPGIIGLINGILSIVVMLAGCAASCSGLPAFLVTAPLSSVLSIAGLVLGFYAKGGLRTASLVLNGIVLGGIAVVVLVVLFVVVILGIGIAGFAAANQR
jgi:DNA-directed RNA polymerase subunit RPC12/RpoP